MSTITTLESSEEIEKVAYHLLKKGDAFNVFPTPVDRIVQQSKLCVDQGLGIHQIPTHYLSRFGDSIVNVLSKVFGALDRRKKIIYLNPTMNIGKKAFVSLHEVGHDALPWQRDIFDFVDDENTLCPDVKELFEAEANYFASAMLFQLDRFDYDIQSLPLEIKTIMVLSQKYGASLQATFRRYVERLHKRAALIVLNKPGKTSTVYNPFLETGSLPLRNLFTSTGFAADYPDFKIPTELSIDWPFVLDYFSRRRMIDEPQPFTIVEDNDIIEMEYRYFNSGHNIFALITPPGEKIFSRTNIIVS